MKNNKVVFDLGSANKFYKWYKFESIYKYFDKGYCDVSFNQCVNNHSIEDCPRRKLIEQFMFTRPWKERK